MNISYKSEIYRIYIYETSTPREKKNNIKKKTKNFKINIREFKKFKKKNKKKRLKCFKR